MQKRVYTKDLSLDEILKRLVNDEIMYLNDGDEAYIKKESDALVQYENNKLTIINPAIFNGDEDNYFLDEVEESEPEADESCIDKLCLFWNDSDYAQTIGILINIRNSERKYESRDNVWEHCRPLNEKEALALVKE